MIEAFAKIIRTKGSWKFRQGRTAAILFLHLSKFANLKNNWLCTLCTNTKRITWSSITKALCSPYGCPCSRCPPRFARPRRGRGGVCEACQLPCQSCQYWLYGKLNITMTGIPWTFSFLAKFFLYINLIVVFTFILYIGVTFLSSLIHVSVKWFHYTYHNKD